MATWNGIVKLSADGSIAKVVHPVVVKDCDSDPADHNPANAASRCCEDWAWMTAAMCTSPPPVAIESWKITPDGTVTSILKSERPLVSDGRGGERQRYLRPRIHQCQRCCDGRLAAAREEDCWR